MADFLYNNGGRKISDGTYPFVSTTIKLMLAAAGYVANRDHDFVSEGGANDATDHEISGTGYVAGFGNAGRKTLASKTVTTNKTNDRVEFDAADVTWTAIDVATEPSHLLAIKENASDADSDLLSHHDFSVVTNGGDITAQIADLWRLSTV